MYPPASVRGPQSEDQVSLAHLTSKTRERVPKMNLLAAEHATEQAQTLAYGTLSSLLVLVLFVIYAQFIRKQRVVAKQMGLPRTQRMRNVWQQWLDPLIIVLVAGVILWADLVGGMSHVIAAAVGVVIGLGLGWVRGRLEYVRYVPEHNSMILKVTIIEVVMLLFLVLVKFGAEYFEIDLHGILLIIISGIIFIDIGDSIGKSAHLTMRLRRDRAVYRAGSPAAVEDAAPPA